MKRLIYKLESVFETLVLILHKSAALHDVNQSCVNVNVNSEFYTCDHT